MSILTYIFQAPKPATYSTTSFPGELCWFPDKIPCLWLPYKGSDTVLIYMHGNASDLGTDRDFAWRISHNLRVNVLAVEFCGYGPIAAWELPTEENLFKRVERVCETLSAMPQVKSILILGYSLGATAAIHLAAHTTQCEKVKCLLLYAPFSSVHDLIEDVTKNTLASNALKSMVPNHVFHNHATLSRIRMPIAIFHGSADQLIPFRHARQLESANPMARLFMLPDVGHNISATSRGETRLFEVTRRYLDENVELKENVVITGSQFAITLPAEFWVAPSLLQLGALPSRDHEVGRRASRYAETLGNFLLVFGVLTICCIVVSVSLRKCEGGKKLD